MGAVVAARHLQLEERVAIKFLLPAMLQNEEVVQRFLREARAAIRIRSEVLDFRISKRSVSGMDAGGGLIVRGDF
jgi:serine/threonine protein kinase